MERLLLVGISGAALGILGQALFALTWGAVLYVVFLGTVVWCIYGWKRIPIALTITVLLLGAALGMVRTELVQTALPKESAYLLQEGEQELQGIVVSDPDLRETAQRLTIEVEGVRVLVVAPLYPSVRYGDTIRVTGTTEAPESFETTEGRTFAYDQFLAKDGIFLVMKDASVTVMQGREGLYTKVRGTLSDLKVLGIEGLSQALPEPHASLAAGLILGGKQGLGAELLSDFIRTGLVHIVVLSGYNVMIVAEFVMRAFGFLSQGLSSAFGAVTIGLFVLAAGAGPASIRAGLMAAIALYARATGKTYEAFRALVVSGVAMLLWNPLTLPYDPGFQLSFIATLGLIFGAPITERWLSWIRSSFVREIASATLAAQIAVLPLLLYQNGLFSFVALPANLLVLPVIPLAMLASFVALIVGATLPVVAPVIALPAYALLSYVIAVVELAAALPFASVTLPAFSFSIVLISYALLGRYVWVVSCKREAST